MTGDPKAFEDRLEGLGLDLEAALGVLWRHGDKEAHDWLWLNYPSKARAFALGSQIPTNIDAKRMGSAGGKARSQKLTPERRHEIAKNAARVRWWGK